MSQIEQLKNELALPPVCQIGVAVRDVSKTAEVYSTLFGVGPFNVYEATIHPYWYRDDKEPSTWRVKQGKAMMGNVELELMQHLEGRSAVAEWLEVHGEGLHHLGFLVSDFDGYARKFAALGFAPLLRVETFSKAYNGELKAACFDTTRVGGIIFEIFYKSWLLKP